MKRIENGLAELAPPAGGDARGPGGINRNFGISTGLNRKLLPERHYE